MGIAPSEFWQMPPEHFWWLVEASTAEAKPAGSINDDEKDELMILLARAREGLL